jgi:hypothetical protein
MAALPDTQRSLPTTLIIEPDLETLSFTAVVTPASSDFLAPCWETLHVDLHATLQVADEVAPRIVDRVHVKRTDGSVRVTLPLPVEYTARLGLQTPTGMQPVLFVLASIGETSANAKLELLPSAAQTEARRQVAVLEYN